ncbi:hypothetical protein pb186bvf_015206 [Paramecium bursaria]
MRLLKQISKYSLHKEIDIKQASLLNIIRNEIQEKGPISFPNFWNKALLHEKFGYYMKQDVFNKDGDFVTSVEISQMFNEIIGVWIINALKSIGTLDDNLKQKEKINIVEFGPGLGTLSSHIFRVFQQFGLQETQYSYIEQSEFMKKKQQQNVTEQLQKHGVYLKYDYEDTKKVERLQSDKVNLRWFKQYEQLLIEDFGDHTFKGQPIKQPPVIFIAHEFFDALPVYIFEYDGQQWLERHVDLDSDKKTLIFRALPTNNVNKILKPEQFTNQGKQQLQKGDTIEICPQGSLLVNSMAEMISKIGGASLIIDYGEKRAFSDSIRAIQRHKILDKDAVLNKPGDCDLSAYVNFLALEQAAKKVNGVIVPELLTQAKFLEEMGINLRLQILQKNANKQNSKRLQSEYERLVTDMGQNFKFMLIQNKLHDPIFPFIEQSQQIYY